MFGYKLKYRIKVAIVIWRKWRRSIDRTITPERTKLSPYEEKTIKLWKILLKDEDTQMAYNNDGIRQIEKDGIFMIFQPTESTDFVMTLMNIEDNGKSLYELYIPSRHSCIVSDYFDDEMEKRMRKTFNSKRSIMETDIDKLLKKEEYTYQYKKNRITDGL